MSTDTEATTTEYQWPDNFWPHQTEGCRRVVEAVKAGKRRIVLASPTGMGKSRMMIALTERAMRHWERVAMYIHRRLLFAQLHRVLNDHNVEHGCRASGYKPALLRDLQVCMTQTEVANVFKKQKRTLHEATWVLTDELHAQGGDMLPSIHQIHYDQGAAIVGVTATPLDLTGEWDELIVAGNTATGRKCGALVHAVTYCPDEPDMRFIGKQKIGEDSWAGDDLTDTQNSNVMFGPRGIYRPKVFGRIYSHWERLNPERKPAILFAPDVPGSIYFAEEFHKRGVRAAHIDAKQVWWNGEYHESTDQMRADILGMTENGEVEILCNRFVLREGIDLPHIYHCIFACVMGSLKTYLQSGGRALRAHHSLDHVIIQDHGANYRRHGSLNESREWELGQKGRITTGIRREQMRQNPQSEPIRCPQCGAMRLSGPQCLQCGHASWRRSRVVVQHNGELKLVEGPALRPRRTELRSDTEEKWIKIYHRAKSKKWDATFTQARGLFYYENGYYPPENLPFMPREIADWFDRTALVPLDRLY